MLIVSIHQKNDLRIAEFIYPPQFSSTLGMISGQKQVYVVFDKVIPVNFVHNFKVPYSFGNRVFTVCNGNFLRYIMAVR